MKEEIELNEVKDKKGKGSGSKDACYHKVKSRYSVWPSAYASGALVKCRKVGAANWGNKSEAIEYTGPKKGDLKGYGSKEFKEYEKNMDPKKRQALKDKATKGMKFTHEGTSYGLYKGSGKPSGAMRKYLDNAKKMQQADKKKKKTGNPAFDDPSHHSNAKNRTEEYINEVKRSRSNPGGYTKDQIDANRENLKKNIKDIPNKIKNIKDKIKKDGLIKFTDAKKRREELGNKDYTIFKPGFDAGLSKDVDITKDGPKKVLTQVGKDKVVKPIVDKGKEIVNNAASKITSGAKDAITKAGKAASTKIGRSILGGAAIIGGAALASKALSKRKERKEKEKTKSEQVTFQQFQEKCWAGYEKKGMKTMFGKRYPNCVKKKK